TTAVVQYPVAVSSSFMEATAPRLSGAPSAVVYRTGAADTIATIATFYGVAPLSVAAILGPVVGILATGNGVTYDDAPYTLLGTDTIDSVMAHYSVTSYEDFADGIEAPDGFFLPYTTINVFAVQ